MAVRRIRVLFTCRQPKSALEEVQLQVASRFGGGRVALEAARQVRVRIPSKVKFLAQKSVIMLLQAVSAQAGNPRQQASATPHTVSDYGIQPASGEKSPAMPASPDKHRPHSPDYKRMFRFEGHFNAPNNPDLPESQPSAELHQQTASTHTLVEPSNDMPVHVSVTSTEGFQQTQSMGHVKASDIKSAVRQAQASARPESEFRRSHSPEFYNAKFKRYALR